jgi:hypothetical protein
MTYPSLFFEHDLIRLPGAEAIIPTDPVPSVYLYSMQILGLFPYPFTIPVSQQHSKRSQELVINKYLLFWSTILWLAMTFSIATYTDDYVRFYYEQLGQLEFFIG